MKKDDEKRRGSIGIQPLIAGVIVAFVSLMSVLFIPGDEPLADMRIEPVI